MTGEVDWNAAEEMGLVSPLSEIEHIDAPSEPLSISGAAYPFEIPRPLFSTILEQPLMNDSNDIKAAANELLQTYGDKAVLIASDKATLASYARNAVRRDFWVAVFTEIRRTHPKKADSSVGENVQAG